MVLLLPGETEAPALVLQEIAPLPSCVCYRSSVCVSARWKAWISFLVSCPDLMLHSGGGVVGLLFGSMHLQ